MRGSALGLTFLYLLEASAPRMTPTRPVTTVSTPKIRLMEKSREGLVSRWHQDRGPAAYPPVRAQVPTESVAVGPFPSLLTNARGSLGPCSGIHVLPYPSHPLSCLILGMPLAMWVIFLAPQHPSSQPASLPAISSTVSPPKTAPLRNLNSTVPHRPQPSRLPGPNTNGMQVSEHLFIELL